MKPKRLRVSIVIPAYNEERHLEACLESIAKQDPAPFEVIIVDNNSTDRTAEIAQSFPFVTLVREKRQGIVYARNAGFDAARGDVIARFDADSQLPPGWVGHITEFYSQDQTAGLAWSGTGYFTNVRLPRLISFMHGFFLYRFNKLLTGDYSLWGSNMAVTKEQWRKVRSSVCLRTDIHEDFDLTIHLDGVGYKVVFDPGIPVVAELKRFQTGREKLWDYLEWWPRTLRVHGSRWWPFAWFLGTFMLYYLSFGLVAVDKIARAFTVPVRLYRRLAIRR